MIPMDKIEWRDMYVYGDKYQISSIGLVRNKETGCLLKSQEDGKGYLRTTLSKNNKQVTIKNHRAIAIAFIDNPKKLPQVNHIDGDKKNNAVDNLEWITNYENMQHAIKHGLINRVDYCGRKKRAVIRIADDGTEKEFASLAIAAEECQVHRSNLCKTLKGERHKCGGYSWKYSEESEVAVND